MPREQIESDYEVVIGEAEANGRAPDPDREMAEVQAAAAGLTPVVTGTAQQMQRVTFLGKEFRIADRIGLMPLLKFASAQDMNTEDPRALAAMYALLRDCIYEGHPGCGDCDACDNDQETQCPVYDKGDWRAFEDHAMVTKADAEDMLDVVSKVVELIAARPTPPRSGSSDGGRTTSRSSTGNSSGRRAGGRKR